MNKITLIKTIIIDAEKFEDEIGESIGYLKMMFKNVKIDKIIKKRVFIVSVDFCGKNRDNFIGEYTENLYGYSMFDALYTYELK